MPFITTEEVREIRNAVKKAFPEYKFSVTKEHHSSVTVTVMEGPEDFNGEFFERQAQVNQYYFKNHYSENPKFVEFMGKLIDVVNNVKPKQQESYDGDYGSIPNYYQNFHVGKWNKPYKKVVKKAKKVKKSTKPSYAECFEFAFGLS